MGIDYNKAKVKRLQTQLSNLGLYDGDIDGNYDNVSGVVAKYQKDNGIDTNDVKSGELNQSTWDSIMKNAPPISGTPISTGTAAGNESDTVYAANNLLNSQSKPLFSSPAQGQIDDVIGQINKYKDFSFDLNSDAFFEQYKDQFMKQGKLAMMDTMGRSQAMTGGYGNSYAQSVGQQAYNAELENLDDVALNLYTQAYNRWQDKRSALYDRYILLSNERDAELKGIETMNAGDMEDYLLRLVDLGIIDYDTAIRAFGEYSYEDGSFAKGTDQTADYTGSGTNTGRVGGYVSETEVEKLKAEAVNDYVAEQEAKAAREQALEESTADIVQKLDMALSMQEVVNIYGSKGVAVAAGIDGQLQEGNIDIDEAKYLVRKYGVTEKDLDDWEALKKQHQIQ